MHGVAALLLMVVVAVGTQGILAQAPVQSTPAGPTFEVVSIKQTPAGARGSANERPDGGFTMTNIPVSTLIARAFPPAIPVDMIGLPDWARRDRYDVSATSPLSRPTTADERVAMMRAMLADRFKLVAHFEQREQPAYELVLVRNDGRLGPGLELVDESVDCEARTAAERAAAEAAGQPLSTRPFPDLNGPPPPCTIFTRGAQMEANITMAGLASFLRATAGRPVMDKTGLKGMYHVVLEYDRLAGIRGPAPTDTPDAPPSVFTALPEQLGLKLESATALRETLIIDRLERPTEN